MKPTVARWGLAAILVALLALAGCGGSSSGGGDTGVSTPPPVTPPTSSGTSAGGAPTGTAVITAAAANPSTTNTAANPNQAFGLIASVGAAPVTIQSPPVVNFTVIDSTGKFVSGLKLVNTAAASNAAATAADANCSGANVTFVMSQWDGTYWKPVIGRQRLLAGSALAKANPTQFAVVEGTTDPKPTAGSQTVVKSDGTRLTGQQIKNADDAAAIADPTKRIVGVLQENAAGGYYTYYFATDVAKATDLAAAFKTADATVLTQGTVGTINPVAKDGKTIHRIGAQLCYVDPATNAKTVANPVMDFTINADGTTKPVTASDGKTLAFSRQVVTKNSCNECHQTLAVHGTRVEPALCVNCHNPGSTDYATNNPLDFRLLIHRIHFGPGLINDFKIQSLVIKGTDASGDVSGTVYPQDIRNCTKCHDGSATAKNPTAQGDNWKNNPSRAACGSCHDGINFDTGRGTRLDTTATFKGHIGGVQKDDSKCALCHNADTIPTYHVAATPPNENSSLHVATGTSIANTAWLAGNLNNLPANAIKVSYDIQSVSVNASGNPVMVFRLLQNGQRADFNTYSATGKTELWDSFMGGPGLEWSFAVPQDGIKAPADFNARIEVGLRQLWNGSASGNTKGTLTGPDSNGYYTATITGSKVPSTAVMLTGGIGYLYSAPSATTAATGGTMPLTQTNLPDYPITVSPVNKSFYTGGFVVVAENVSKVATGATGRRVIVDDSKCNKCHEQLGLFTDESFHAGQRNNAPTCAFCHRPNQGSSGWSASSNTWVHAIHGAEKRTVPYTWHATTSDFTDIKMPPSLSMPNSNKNVLRNCETCHVPGMFDYSNSATTSAYPNMLWNTVGQGIYGGSVGTSYQMNNLVSSTTASTGTCGLAASATTITDPKAVLALSPYIAKSTSSSVVDYGPGFVFNASATAVSNGCSPGSTASASVSNNSIVWTVGATTPPGSYTFYSVPPQGSREADGTTLVTSPLTAACVSCHDGKNRTGTMADVKAHMIANGGSFYEPRSGNYLTGTTTLVNTESCLTCHGATSIAPIAAMHKK